MPCISARTCISPLPGHPHVTSRHLRRIEVPTPAFDSGDMDAHTRAVVTLLLTLLPSMVAAESPARPVVPVRVYDTSGLPTADLQRALETAGMVVADAGIMLTWSPCVHTSASASDATAPCAGPLAQGELIVRIIRAFADARPAAFLPLGDALVDPQARRGVFATIYADHVRWTAQEAEVDPGTLLGRALAHEVGHLLMATTAHAARGLMRAAWLREELRRDQPADWSFGPDEQAAMRARISLTRPPCPGAARHPG